MLKLLGRTGVRGAAVGGAYLLTSLIVVGVIYALGRLGRPALLREVLAIHFIASLAGGLDPATAKTAALRRPESDGDVSINAVLVASAIKGCLAAPILALVWRAADPSVSMKLLAWLPLICVAGFGVTDLRVRLDLSGRYVSAILLKQGSLSLGLLILASLAAMGVKLSVGLGAATSARLAVVAIGAGLAASPRARFDWSEVRTLMADPRWFDLAAASAVAAFSGSADRVFGLRFLSAPVWAAYYLLYEVLGKFWFIPYVLTPILFARTASGVGNPRASRAAWGFTAACGGLFVSGTGLILAIAPSLPARLLGAHSAAQISNLAIVAFAAAVAINSLSQLRIAELQGRGEARRTLVLMAISAVITTALFYFAAMRFGVSGLLIAWLIKSIVELAATYVAPSRGSKLGARTGAMAD